MLPRELILGPLRERLAAATWVDVRRLSPNSKSATGGQDGERLVNGTKLWLGAKSSGVLLHSRVTPENNNVL